ncbi:MAG TPA: FtsX-like permease family protein, partial [Streptosporangiaceae bacterium]|nr:FtsX-like permease family protein [Streptosporangiaceae bacterium]
AVRAGGDLALLALGAAAVLELRAYSAGSGSAAGVDPVLAVAPALALAGIAVIPLRVLPAAARILDRIAAAGRHLSAALASWEISRRPIRQAVPALLAILAVATGTLSLAQYQSWRQSALDQAAFSAGADVRVDTPVPVPVGTAATITRAPGVIAAAPVTAEATGSGGDVLGLDTHTAAATVLLRRDLSPLPAAALWRRITPPDLAPGLDLPGRPARLEITAALAAGPAPGQLGAASVTASVQDAHGAVYAVQAGVLPADGRRHRLTAVLAPARRASYPLRLLGLSLTYAMAPAVPGHFLPPPASLAITSITASAAGPVAAPAPDGHALAAWRPAASSAGLSSTAAPAEAVLPTASGAEPAVTGWRTGAGGSQVLTFRPGRGPAASQGAGGAFAAVTLTAPLPAGAITGIATRAFLRNNSIGVGATAMTSIGSATVPVHIVAEVAAFPTVTGDGGALIVDLAALQDALAARLDPPLPVTSWWLRTAAGAVPPGLPAGATITSRARRAAGLLSDPVSAAPQEAALAVAAAAALLAAIGFSVSIAAGLRSRRAQNAMLAALGVSRSAQTRQLCLEELMLCLPAAGAGLLAGIGLAHLLIPAVTVTAAATVPIPPALVEVPLGWAIGLAVTVAVFPVLVAAVTVARRPDPAAQLRAAEAA